MQYRKFGKLDFTVSALGFGAMRLPEKDGKIDEAKATKMLHYAIDNGVNYVDTAYPYHDGQSEAFLGKALKGGYREKVKLATKLPSWMIKSADDFDEYLNEQLKRLGQDSVDIYLLHTLNHENWPKLRDLGVIEWAEKARREGKFQYLGFSFHDDGDAFAPIVDAYDWDLCQIQYNFIDIKNQAGMKGLKYAASKGIAMMIMEPLLGGKLAGPPEPIRDIWDRADQKRSPIDWALRWLWNQPEVGGVLSGMSSMAQVEENVALASAADYDRLSKAEMELYDQVRVKYKDLTAIPCTSCGYCMPCPQHVDIPGNFGPYNDAVAFDALESMRGHYDWMKYAHEVQHIYENDIRAASCIQCGECEEKCPQGIPISQWMTVIHEVLGEGKPMVKSL